MNTPETALGFIVTGTGDHTYTATDAQVAWWNSRDCCPGCGAIVEPVRTDPDGTHHYRCGCEGPAVEWSRHG